MPACQLFCRAMQKIGASSEFCAHALNSALFSVILNLVVRIRISFRGSVFHGNTDPYFQNLFVLLERFDESPSVRLMNRDSSWASRRSGARFLSGCAAGGVGVTVDLLCGVDTAQGWTCAVAKGGVKG